MALDQPKQVLQVGLRGPAGRVPVGTIKKHATGKGNASKQEMVACARARGHQPADDNEADALALLYLAADTERGAQ